MSFPSAGRSAVGTRLQAKRQSDIDEVAVEELALERTRILSRDGRDEAAARWYASDRGPATAVAIHASAPCNACGFWVPLQGALGQVFGVCANEWSSDDGRVVSLDHGCGAHSETDTPQVPSLWADPSPLIDELTIDIEEAVGTESAEGGDSDPEHKNVDGDKPIDSVSGAVSKRAKNARGKAVRGKSGRGGLDASGAGATVTSPAADKAAGADDVSGTDDAVGTDGAAGADDSVVADDAVGTDGAAGAETSPPTGESADNPRDL